MHRRTNYPLPCLLWLFLLPLMVHSQVSMSCVNRTTGPSHCMDIRECEPLLILFTWYEAFGNDYTWNTLCNNDTTHPMVCCPSNSQDIAIGTLSHTLPDVDYEELLWLIEFKKFMNYENGREVLHDVDRMIRFDENSPQTQPTIEDEEDSKTPDNVTQHIKNEDSKTPDNVTPHIEKEEEEEEEEEEEGEEDSKPPYNLPQHIEKEDSKTPNNVIQLIDYSKLNYTDIICPSGIHKWDRMTECDSLLNLHSQYGSSCDSYLDTFTRSAFYGNLDLRNVAVCCPNDFVGLEQVAPSEWPNGPFRSPVCGVHVDVTRRDGKIERTGNRPSLVFLGYDVQAIVLWKCRGTLISARHVLTAAYCVVNEEYLNRVRLRGIEYNPNVRQMYDSFDNPMDLSINKTFVHPMYNSKTLENNIAVLELASVIPWNVFRSGFIRPICLPLPDVKYDLSYGNLTYHAFRPGRRDVMHVADFTDAILKSKQCHQNKDSAFGERIICVENILGDGSTDYRDNTGAALTNTIERYLEETHYLIGVQSFYRDQGSGVTKIIFTKVEKYLDFILSHLNSSHDDPENI